MAFSSLRAQPVSRQCLSSMPAVPMHVVARAQRPRLAPSGQPCAQRQARPSRQAGLRVLAIDAAQPFDFEGRMAAKIAKDKQLKIGIVGFGTFGQFLAKRLIAAGHKVIAHSRTPYHKEAAAIGAEYFTDVDDFCEEHPEVVVLASSILSTDKVLAALPVQRLKRSTLFVDVLSVKVFPKQLLLNRLPPQVDILCTHPMFGPDSGKGSWAGLNFMYEKVRVGADKRRQARVDAVLKFFAGEGCNMVEMTCEEHDRQAASTQFITHTVGRILGAMDLKSTDINTKGFDALLNLVNNTTHDSFELYYGLFLYNQNATEELERLEVAFDHVKKQLFGRLHDIARKQLFPDGVRPGSPPPASLPPASGDASSGSSSGGAASSSNGHGQALSGRGAGEQHNGSSGSGSSGRRALTAGGQLAAGASDGVVIDVDFTQETSRVTAN